MIRKLRAGMMPPAGAKRPDAATLAALTTALEGRMDETASVNPNPGSRPFQRLNRAEYAAAVKDLLRIDVDVTTFLPPDTISHGFDNVADAQGFSPTLMEGYLRAAGRIATLALGDPTSAPTESTYKVPRTQSQMEHIAGAPIGTRGGVALVHVFPADGDYSFRAMLHSIPTGQLYGSIVRGEKLEISIDGERVALLDINHMMSEQDDNGMNLQSPRVHVTAGPHRVAAAFLRQFEAPVDDIIAPQDYTLADSQIGSSFGITTLPHVRDFAISGPFAVTGVSDTVSRRTVFTCRPTATDEEAGCAAEILKRLASQAYREPATARDVEALMGFYRSGREGADFEAGIRAALEALLASPRFVFRLEQPPATARVGDAFAVADLDLASRLSFFLWGTVPDAELIRVATSGGLKTGAGLDKQVRRMLADPKSEALATRFAHQWLRLQDVEKIRPDALLFPYWDYTLAENLVRETELFFDSLVRDDRSILDLLRADYTFANERVARHYGLPNVMGQEFRRVPVPDERRGILGQGSILLLTSVADRTSPVQRGKWVMEVLLGIAAAAAAAQRPAARRDRRGPRWTGAVGARADGRAPQEPGLHLVPQGDRSARPGARELRRHRPVAGQGRRRRGGRQRRALRRHPDERAGGAARGAAEAPGRVPPELHRAPDDLRARPPHRSVRHGGGAQGDSRRRRAGLEALGVRPRRGQLAGVPDEPRGALRDDRARGRGRPADQGPGKEQRDDAL